MMHGCKPNMWAQTRRKKSLRNKTIDYHRLYVYDIMIEVHDYCSWDLFDIINLTLAIIAKIVPTS